MLEAIPDKDSIGGWRVKYGYQDLNPGKPGVDAELRKLADSQAGVSFDIPVEQKTRPGLIGKLRIEARPWS